MISEHDSIPEQLTTTASNGRLTRRAFLERSIALGIGSGAALTLLNACGSSPTTDLTYWNLFTGGDGVRMVQMQKDFTKSHPNINFEADTLTWGDPYYTKLAMASAGGRPPDVGISHLSRVPAFAASNMLDPFDLNELAKYDISEDKFLPSLWQKAQYNGKLYAIPLDTHPFVMYYNIDVCQKAGLLGPDGKLKPLDGTAAVMDALKKAQAVTGNLGLALDTRDVQPWRLFYTLYNQLGGQILSSDGRTLVIDEGKAEQALSFMRDLTITNKVASSTMDYGGAVATFGSGKAGFHWNGDWELPTFQGQNLHFDMLPIPNFFGQTYYAQADSHSFVLPHQATVDPTRRAASLEFISFMLKDSLVWAGGGHVPAYLPVATGNDYKNMSPQSHYASVASNVVFDPVAWFSGSGSELENQAGQAFQTVLVGQFTPQQAIAQFSAALQKLLKIPPPL
ncbi:MAG TPA: extracellular solute-binding protein [Ktedonobacteraceae bacterium]|nr:extracellular solute-binding protein [Ktedonobacteraceae bacterium]